MTGLHVGHSVRPRVFIFPPQFVEASGNEQADWQVVDEMLATQQLTQGRVRHRIDEAQRMFVGVVGVESGIQAADVLNMKKTFASIQPTTRWTAAPGALTFSDGFVDVVVALTQIAKGQIQKSAHIIEGNPFTREGATGLSLDQRLYKRFYREAGRLRQGNSFGWRALCASGVRGRRGQYFGAMVQIVSRPFINILGDVFTRNVLGADMKYLRQFIPAPFKRSLDGRCEYSRIQELRVDYIVVIQFFRVVDKLCETG